MSLKISRFKLAQEHINELVLTNNYRDFIQKMILLKKTGSTKYGYSDLARFSGFSSRSFPRDVVLGKKRISLVSIPKFVKGLGLTGDMAQYFRYLVELEHEDCRTKKKSTPQIEKCIVNLKQRLTRSTNTHSLEAQLDLCYKDFNIPIVYAALGPIDVGATFIEIVKKTNLDETSVTKALDNLEKISLIKVNKKKYIAIDNHLDRTELRTSELLKNFYLNLLQKAYQTASKNFDKKTNLHFNSCFSINESDLPALREELKNTLLSFVDQGEAPTGDKVISLVCSLF